MLLTSIRILFKICNKTLGKTLESRDDCSTLTLAILEELQGCLFDVFIINSGNILYILWCFYVQQ